MGFVSYAVLLALARLSVCDDEPPPPCDSDIYCHGPLLHTIQMAKIYPDSKTFVDMKMKYPPNETKAKFETFMELHNQEPTVKDVKHFVNVTFEEAGQEFEDWEPEDWKPHPSFVDRIADDAFRRWGGSLNAIWKDLGRKLKPEVKENVEFYSIIWVPNPVIVPGGRFREFYYWDSYWIVQGLLHSEMYATVMGMLENFLYIVDTYGHIPNGGRIYYLARSQPPLLLPMIKLYLDATRNVTFLRRHIDTMEREFTYWTSNHTKTVEIDGNNYTLAYYGDKSNGPRPESYSEDVETAEVFKEQVKKEAFYSELKAAAESGWDFSSRWFVSNATNKGNLTSIKTRSILPVDLNAVIYWNAVLLSDFYAILGNPQKSQHYKEVAETWLQAVEAVLWHEEAGTWLDYDTSNAIKRDYFYPTNISPLWTGCYRKENKESIVRHVMKYLQNKNIMYPGGVPTTVEHTGEQWDYPNAWPPLQHMMIVGLNNTGDEAAVRLAYEIAEIWVRSNYKAFNETEAMYEKYDATVPGGYGGGGEYELQLGFGWTNGIIMDLLDRYGGVLRVDDYTTEPAAELQQDSAAGSFGQVATVLLALLVSLTAGFIGVCIYKRRNGFGGGGQQNNHVQRGRAARVKYTELRNMPKRSRSNR